MSTTIRRDALNYLPITCTTNPATTGGIPMRLASGALLMVESLEGGASSVTFYAKETADSDSFYVLVDASGTPITQNLFGGQAFPLPTETFAATFVAIQTNAGTAQIKYSAKG